MDLSRFYFISDPINDVLTSEENQFLKKSAQQRVYGKGKMIFQEGTFPKGVYILDKGKVKIFQKTLDGAEQIMNLHVEGEIFGYRPLLCDQRYPVSASAIEECRISFLPRKQFVILLKRSPALATTLLRFLSMEFTVWVNTVTNLTQRTVKERLLLNLVILTEKYRTKKKWPVEIMLSRADLAAFTGTSNETLARMIKLLKSDRYLSLRGRTIIFNNQHQLDKIIKALGPI